MLVVVVGSSFHLAHQMISLFAIRMKFCKANAVFSGFVSSMPWSSLQTSIRGIQLPVCSWVVQSRSSRNSVIESAVLDWSRGVFSSVKKFMTSSGCSMEVAPAKKETVPTALTKGSTILKLLWGWKCFIFQGFGISNRPKPARYSEFALRVLSECFLDLLRIWFQKC